MELLKFIAESNDRGTFAGPVNIFNERANRSTGVQFPNQEGIQRADMATDEASSSFNFDKYSYGAGELADYTMGVIWGLTSCIGIAVAVIEGEGRFSYIAMVHFSDNGVMSSAMSQFDRDLMGKSTNRYGFIIMGHDNKEYSRAREEETLLPIVQNQLECEHILIYYSPVCGDFAIRGDGTIGEITNYLNVRTNWPAAGGGGSNCCSIM